MSYYHSTRKILSLIVGFSILLLSACATIDPDFADPRDPYESFNRTVHDFNEVLDENILKPVSQGYQAITPEPVDQGISNFFNNIADLNSVINNLLQLKIHAAMEDFSRVLVNSFLGVFGVFDIASDLEIPRHDEDFGQTLGHWGITSGPYLVLPFLGPSSGRDGFGRLGDMLTHPMNQVEVDAETRMVLNTINVIDTRADLLDASRMMEEAALGDTYTFLRDSYLQKRLNAVHDGNPPESRLDEQF